MAMPEIKRYGLVRGNFGTGCNPAERVAAYMPSNYKVIYVTTWPAYPGQVDHDVVVVIEGRDVNSFTLEGYVAPRLGSGMMACEEIDLTHPLMKLIPA
jgi:hypothetical protein